MSIEIFGVSISIQNNTIPSCVDFFPPTISDTLSLILTGEQYSSGALDQLVLTREYCTLKKWLQLIKTTDSKIFFHKAKKKEKL